MNFLSSEFLQLIAWFLCLVVFILTLYIVILNPRHTANRHVSGLLLLITANLFGLGLMAGGGEAVWLGMLLSAATIPAIPPAILITSIVLLKPQWLRGRWRWALWSVYGLVLLPIALTVVDMALGRNLWYTGLGPEDAISGFMAFGDFTNGVLSSAIQTINVYIMSTAPIFFVLYVAVLDKEASQATRRLAWLLLAVQVATVTFQLGLRNPLGDAVAMLFTSTFYVLGYSYAAFQQMISERRAMSRHQAAWAGAQTPCKARLTCTRSRRSNS